MLLDFSWKKIIYDSGELYNMFYNLLTFIMKVPMTKLVKSFTKLGINYSDFEGDCGKVWAIQSRSIQSWAIQSWAIQSWAIQSWAIQSWAIQSWAIQSWVNAK